MEGERDSKPPVDDEGLATHHEDQGGAASRRRELTQTIDLIHGYQNGNLGDLNRLFERYYPRVLADVRVRMGPKLRARFDPEDLVQETFVTAIEALKELTVTEPAGFRHWMAQVALNRIRGTARYVDAEKRTPRAEVALEGLRAAISTGRIQLDPPGDVPTPSGVASGAEVQEILEECVDLLSEDYREVVLLRDFSAGSWQWVGEQMNRSPEAVGMLYGRAKVALGKLVGPRLGR